MPDKRISYAGRIGAAIVKAPIYFYRAAISPLIGPRCRYAPTCSRYALDAITLNGPWAGFWLTLGRMARCHPWGGCGYDPAPDLRAQGIPFWAIGRYFRWAQGNRNNVEPCSGHINNGL